LDEVNAHALAAVQHIVPPLPLPVNLESGLHQLVQYLLPHDGDRPSEHLALDDPVDLALDDETVGTILRVYQTL
jgi:hypothetical protein